MNKSAYFRSKELTSVPSITDGHLLFVHSSAPSTIVFDYSQVAQSFTTWRHIGFTSFPLMPGSAAAESFGVRDSLFTVGFRERIEVHDPQFQTYCLLATAPLFPARAG
jgi:hypothetical protein